MLTYMLNKDGKLTPVYLKDKRDEVEDNQKKDVNRQVYEDICEKGGGLDIQEYASMYLFDLLLMKEAATNLFSRHFEDLEIILNKLGYDTNQNNWMWFYRSEGLVCKNKNTGEVLPY